MPVFDDYYDLDRRESGPDKAGYEETLSSLHKAMVALPSKLRQTIVLHYMQHLTIAEAAKAAKVGQGTFKSRLNRALNILREKIKPMKE